jgi:hypothetical protein
MSKNSLLLLLGAFVLAAGGALFATQITTDDEPPMVRWSAGDEQEVPADPAAAESAGDLEDGGVERTAVAMGSGPVDERVEVTLRGRVIDRFRAPVPGAMVWLDFGRGGGRGGPAANRQRRVPDPVQTDAEGRFAFQGQTFRNLRVSLQVAHTRFSPGQFDKDIGTVGTEVELGDLVLLAGGEVRGRVTDLEGNGIAGAELRAQPENNNPLRMLRERDRLLPPITTDQNGFFRGTHLAAGDWTLTATAKRHTEGRSVMFVIEEEQAIDIDDIRLGPGYEISGTVRDARGAPIAKANVALQGDARNRGGRGPGGGGPGGGGPGNFGGGREHRATTDERGNFFLEHLPAATMRVEADAEGFLDLRLEGVDPTLGQALQLTMQDGLRIEGKASDTDGTPVTRFAFRAVRLRNLPPPGQAPIDFAAITARLRDSNLSEAERNELRAQLESARGQFGGRGGPMGRQDRGGGGGPGGGNRDLGRVEAHAGGEFVATGLQEGVYELHLQSPDHARYRSAEFELRLGAAVPRLDVRLDGGVYVAGVVRDERDQPVRNARVELRTPSAFEGMGRRGRGNADGGGGGGGAAPAAGQDGGNMAREMMRQFAGAQLTLETTTDAEGEFVIVHAPRGNYRLRAEARGFATVDSEPFDLQADRSGFELRLGNLGSLVGTVRGLADGEAASARVAAVPMGGQGGGIGAMFGRGRGGPGGGGGPFQSVSVAADGSYRIDDLVPGDYLVRSWIGAPQDLMRELMPQFTSGTLPADVSVRAGEPTRHDLQLTRPQIGIVAGTVLHNGSPANGFQVELTRLDDSGAAPEQNGGGPGGRRGGGGFGNFGRSFQGAVAASGNFRIQNVPAGQYRLRVQSGRRGGALHEEVVAVVADATTERHLSLQTHSLRGTMQGEAELDPKTLSGRASLLPGLTEVPENLGAWQRDNPGFDARVQSGGFTFEALKPGNYLLVVTIRGRERSTLPVVVTGDQTVTVPVGKVAAPSADPAGNQPRARPTNGR